MKNLVKMTLFAAILAGFMAQPAEAMQAVQKTPTWKKAVYVGTGIAAVGMSIWYAYNYYYAEQPKEEKNSTTQNTQDQPIQVQSEKDSARNDHAMARRVFHRFTRELRSSIDNKTDVQTFANTIKLICDDTTVKTEIISKALQYKEKDKTLKDLAANTDYASVINNLYTQYKVSLPENKGQGDEKPSTETKSTGRRMRKGAIIQKEEQPTAPKVELPQNSNSSNILEHTNLGRAKGQKKRPPAKKPLNFDKEITSEQPITPTSTTDAQKETQTTPVNKPQLGTDTNHLKDLINKNKRQETPEAIFSRLTTYLNETINSQTIATRIQNIFVGKENSVIVAVLTHKENGQTLKELAANTIYASEINELYRQYAHLLQ